MTKTFSNLLKMELEKGIKNKYFFTTCIIACVFTLFSAWYKIDSYFFFKTQVTYTNTGNPMTQGASLFNHWIGGEFSSLGFTLFFTLFPILAVLPYGWSYFSENKAGYVKAVVTRSGKPKYFLAKYIGVFVTGGLVILLPQILNIIIVASFVPAITPTKLYPLSYAVVHGSTWSEVFYTHPLLYVGLYLILNFIFAGIFATMSLAFSFYIKNRIAVLLIPFFLIFILHYSRTFLAYKFYHEISPLNYLHATNLENPTNTWIILGQGVLFFALTFGITMKLGVKREIY